MYTYGYYKNKWISYVKDILDNCGYSDIWLSQSNVMSFDVFKARIKNRLQDQFKQDWHSQVSNCSKCLNYRIFKTDLVFENYLLNIPSKLRKTYTKFRCRNSKIPIETGSMCNI